MRLNHWVQAPHPCDHNSSEMVLGRDPGPESCVAHWDMESSVQNSGRQALLEACVQCYTPAQTSCWASVKDTSEEETCLHRARASHPPQEHLGSWCWRIVFMSTTSCPCTRSLRKESTTNHPHRHHPRWTGGSEMDGRDALQELL